MIVAGMIYDRSPAQTSSPIPTFSFSILTCSPGPDLYSVFGHTAIRCKELTGAAIFDEVYNYGTFEFSDDFYIKFAKGKLDYMLSRSGFDEFMYEYQMTGRGVWEQQLNLSPTQSEELLKLLEDNLKPENRYYRYDFFYDNCSTRVRDIIQDVCANNGDSINFSYVPPHPVTFRDAIQNNLNYMPWSDFGIDLALGTGCDKTMEKRDYSFLPDSLLQEFDYALRGGNKITSQPNEILAQKFHLAKPNFWKPTNVFFLFLVLQVTLGIVLLKRKTPPALQAISPSSSRSVGTAENCHIGKSPYRQLIIPDRILLFISGLVGALIIFLWFFTDHTTTQANWNILWANPLNLGFAFVCGKRKWQRWYAGVFMISLFIMFFGFFLFTQRLHFATIPIALGLLFVCIKIIRPKALTNLSI